MTVCKHCGTEIEDGLEYCPNCGQSIDENFADFFKADEELEEEAYNIFDSPEEFDMESLLSNVLDKNSEPETTAAPESQPQEDFPLADLFPDSAEADEFPLFQNEEEQTDIPEPVTNAPEEQDDLAELFGLFGNSTAEEPEDNFSGSEDIFSGQEELFPEADLFSEEEGGFSNESEDVSDFQETDASDFFALDDLFQDLDVETLDISQEDDLSAADGLEELFSESAVTTTETKKEEKPQEKKSFFEAVFGNVPVDPKKIKKEPTPEEIAAKKQKEAEAKQAKDEEKRLAAEEKKEIAEKAKAEKARQKALAKEAKKAKKMAEAKLILEEMRETRINRVGATIVFVFFAVIAIVLMSGSDLFSYAVSVHSAEKSFEKAYNNDVKYYTDAYNQIYGLEIKPEDQRFNDQVMTVMFVNKQLNSYNSFMVMKEYETALHALLMGLYQYGDYYEPSILLGIDRDMDFVRSQILKELENTFGISEDEAEVLRSMLCDAGVYGMERPIDPEAAREYNLKLYEIVEESGLER